MVSSNCWSDRDVVIDAASLLARPVEKDDLLAPTAHQSAWGSTAGFDSFDVLLGYLGCSHCYSYYDPIAESEVSAEECVAQE